MRRARQVSAFQGFLLALAVVALAFRIAAPPGTMVTETGHGAALVICTGHGPISAVTPSDKAPASKARSDAGCEFAAHAAHALAAPQLARVGGRAWSPAGLSQPAVLATVGAGLAAPPPPSHAPPALSV